MTVNSQDQVSQAAFDRSLPVPRAFVVTFGWGPHFGVNCEDGVREPPFWFPTVEDVEVFLIQDMEDET